ncbi:phenylacetate--CoA ligase family protein [Candidatus Aerophobetes bacterium]|uniref:Phenylacetate-coenzyme A ligase n=1 Tax=Aerophobetes bacterium TaxID=2030807 RepID=A0A523ULC1_UNCAE|nr:MAG: phenylacetate--CoA ligase family protein [Candidatus Aerophobetes bacterium]
MSIWNPHFECMVKDELKQLELERLQATLNRVYRSVAFYRKLFDQVGLVPDEINSLEELARIPFTGKTTLRQSYPYEMFAVPLRDVVRLQCTSGTTGEPIVVGYTRNDLVHWTEVGARVLCAGGVTKDDVVQICFDYSLFGGGLGFHYGAELIGASVIPGSNLDPARQVVIARDYRTTTLIATPGFGLRVAAVIREKGLSPADIYLRRGLFTGEPFSEVTRKQIEDELNIKATDNYGLSEIAWPGVAAECEKKKGLHIFEDQFIPEIIDPQTEEVLPLGKKGELVLTTIAKEAFPLIRYRTGDITVLDVSPCECGRTLVRMRKVSGRTDEMVTINGVSFFPSQIEHIFSEILGVEPRSCLVIDRRGDQEIVKILVQVSEEIFFDEMKKFQDLKSRVERKIYRDLGISAEVKLVEPDSFARETEGKRVIDKRERS